MPKLTRIATLLGVIISAGGMSCSSPVLFKATSTRASLAIKHTPKPTTAPVVAETPPPSPPRMLRRRWGATAKPAQAKLPASTPPVAVAKNPTPKTVTIAQHATTGPTKPVARMAATAPTAPAAPIVPVASSVRTQPVSPPVTAKPPEVVLPQYTAAPAQTDAAMDMAVAPSSPVFEASRSRGSRLFVSGFVFIALFYAAGLAAYRMKSKRR